MKTKKQKICPRCKESYSGYPAQSRKDENVMICPKCGIRESLEELGIDEEDRERILDRICRTMKGEFDDQLKTEGQRG